MKGISDQTKSPGDGRPVGTTHRKSGTPQDGTDLKYSAQVSLSDSPKVKSGLDFPATPVVNGKNC